MGDYELAPPRLHTCVPRLASIARGDAADGTRMGLVAPTPRCAGAQGSPTPVKLGLAQSLSRARDARAEASESRLLLRSQR
jgi:hypothetical protein